MSGEQPIVLITGGRSYAQRAHVYALLDALLRNYPGMCVAQGGATGADALARAWCKSRGQPCITMPAPWDVHGPAAGTMRNQWMLDYLKPRFVVAFPGGAGTADMKRRATRQGYEVYEG
jgi:hypothetical protein